MSEPFVNISALEPLFAPTKSRIGIGARQKKRESPRKRKPEGEEATLRLLRILRPLVKTWRDSDYPGASDTTRELLHHWFQRDHLIEVTPACKCRSDITSVSARRSRH